MTEKSDLTTTWLSSARADEAIAADHAAWYSDPDEHPIELVRQWFDWDLMLAAEDESGRIVGLLGGVPLQMTVPGPGSSVHPRPCYGLTAAHVHSDVRRRGLFRRLMQQQLEAARERGYAFVALYATEHTIYPRFGFGVADWQIGTTLSAGQELSGAPSAVVEAADRTRTRLVPLDGDDARTAFADLVPRWGAAQLGAVQLPRGVREALDRDVPRSRSGKEPWQVVVAERDGQVVGAASVQRLPKWEQNRPTGTAKVAPFLALDDGARLALARRLTSFDLITTTEIYRQPVLDVLVQWAGGPRAVPATPITDGLYLRIVDVAAALGGRGYAADQPFTMVLAVLDDQLETTRGPWRLAVDASGAATLEPAPDATPDLTVPAQVLAAAYLGQNTLTDLAQSAWPAGEVMEHTPGALTRLSRAMSREDRSRTGYSF